MDSHAILRTTTAPIAVRRWMEARVTMAEYIDRAVCLSVLRAKANMAVLMDAAPYFEKAAQMLEKLPAADVAPVIHCKDCKYSYENIDGLTCVYGPCVDCTVPEDFYCKYGERNTET